MGKYYDVIIVGTGIGGMFTALNIDKSLKVLLISKTSIYRNNSELAQGGIVSCINPDTHLRDTMKAGAFYNDEETIRMLAKHSKENIDKLIGYGVNFDRDEFGSLKLTREGGHSERTILYSKDATGKEIIRILSQAVKASVNIDLLENTAVIRLIEKDKQIRGIVALDKEEKIETYTSRNIVLATGGIGRLYKNTTNRSEMTGDGISLAHEIGAKVKDMEFVQFHPTAMYSDDDSRRFLISEAVRGESAILRNIKGHAFMDKYHEQKDLAPRDIVSRSIVKEMKDTNSKFVYLDISHKDPTYIKARFPNIYKYCMDKGIDMTKEYIKVAPAEHYIMGGIVTDLDGRTNIEGLFACGECACTGLHGANRLASNSLLEGIVFGGKVAKFINNKKNEAPIEDKFKLEDLDYKEDDYKLNLELYIEMEKILKDTMTDYVSIVRNKRGLLKALAIVEGLLQELDSNKTLSKKFFELKNMINVSKIIIKSAIKRDKSLGVHFIVEDDRGEEIVG